MLLRGFARSFEAELLAALRAIVKQAPFRHLITPGGHRMSVAMTNCGSVGWVSDETGYRYDPIDPEFEAAVAGDAAGAAAGWRPTLRRTPGSTASRRKPA